MDRFGIRSTRLINTKGHLGVGLLDAEKVVEGKRKAFNYFRKECLKLNTQDAVIFNMADGIAIKKFEGRSWRQHFPKRVKNDYRCSALS